MNGFKKLLDALTNYNAEDSYQDEELGQNVKTPEAPKKCYRVFEVEGNASDLLEIGQNGEMKQTRLFYLLPEDEGEDCETIDITITSTNPSGKFPIFDRLLGKKIKISVDLVSDEKN